MGKGKTWKLLVTLFCLIIAGWCGLVSYGQTGSATESIVTGLLLLLGCGLAVRVLMGGHWDKL